jgi:CBS domain-containing protein
MPNNQEEAVTVPEALVSDIMRTEFPRLARTDGVAAVAKALSGSGLPGLPVIDGDKIVGIVTESDVIERQADVEAPTPLPFLDAIFMIDAGRKYEDELRRVLARTAEEMMTHPVLSIRASATINQLATLMVTDHVNPVPVVDADNKLVGIVSRSDLVKILARLENDGEGETGQP